MMLGLNSILLQHHLDTCNASPVPTLYCEPDQTVYVGCKYRCNFRLLWSSSNLSTFRITLFTVHSTCSSCLCNHSTQITTLWHAFNMCGQDHVCCIWYWIYLQMYIYIYSMLVETVGMVCIYLISSLSNETTGWCPSSQKTNMSWIEWQNKKKEKIQHILYKTFLNSIYGMFYILYKTFHRL